MISIVVPLFNSERFIGSFLNNLMLQSNDDYELIIIDGGSTDNTIQILEQQKSYFSNIKIVSEPDLGIYDAMNRGINFAKNEWIYFMGADDSFWNTSILNNIEPYLIEENDIVYGDCIWMPDNVKEGGEWTLPFFINRNINHQRIFYKKSLFNKYGNYNLKYKVAADHELNIRFFCNDIIRKRYVPITVASYNAGGFSAKKTDVVFWEDWDEIMLKNFEPHLSKKIIYGSLGNYCRYLINTGEYAEAFKIVKKNFQHTHSLGFVKLMLLHYFKRNNKKSI